MAKTLNLLILCVGFMFILLAHHYQAYSTEMEASEVRKHDKDDMQYGATQGSLRPQECGSKCTYRCSATSFKKPCMFFCQKCCAKCLCVPPGTYGNKQTCPCYNNWKTKRGGPKCP